MTNTGIFIENQRKLAKLEKQELAKMLNITPRQYSRKINGDSPVTLDEIISLGQMLKFKVALIPDNGLIIQDNIQIKQPKVKAEPKTEYNPEPIIPRTWRDKLKS